MILRLPRRELYLLLLEEMASNEEHGHRRSSFRDGEDNIEKVDALITQ